MIQAYIIFTGLFAVWLSQDHRVERRRFACFFGLAAQPAWAWTSFVNDQWGIFALSFVYGAVWIRGVRNHWLNPEYDAGIR